MMVTSRECLQASGRGVVVAGQATLPMEASSQNLGTFASLRLPAFRLYIGGQFIAFVGNWVQRIAQDWLVLSLTGSVTAVGITAGLQSLPIMLFGPIGGVIADRYPRRRVMMATQVAAAMIGLTLAALTITRQVQVWHVYLAALALGVEFSIESPVRYAFISELVGPNLLRNAVSINSFSIQLGGLLGPAISAALLSSIGFGAAFALNAVSYGASITALLLLRHHEPAQQRKRSSDHARLSGGIRYVLGRPEIFWPTLLVGVLSMSTINMPATLTGYSKIVFHSGAGGYGLLTSMLAVGSMTGALISARFSRSTTRTALTAAGSMAALFMLAPLAPNRACFCVALVGLGVALMAFYTSTNSSLLLSAEPVVRGRVMGAYALVYFGGGALGGPIVGWFDERLGPRQGMMLCGVLPAIATALVALKLHGGRARCRVQLPGVEIGSTPADG
jgi:MFS family permease